MEHENRAYIFSDSNKFNIRGKWESNLNVSEHPFSQLKIRNIIFLLGLWKLNETTYVRFLPECVAKIDAQRIKTLII